jgi:hypothetical protein
MINRSRKIRVRGNKNAPGISGATPEIGMSAAKLEIVRANDKEIVMSRL